MRQLLTESAALGLIAGAIALPFTWALLRIAVRMASQNLPDFAVFNVTPDLSIFSFTFGISLTAGILFGLAPAVEVSRSGISSSLRGGTSALRTRRLQDALLAAQVSLSLVLLIAASMLIRSSKNTLSMETGYESKRVVHLSLDFPEGTKYLPERRAAFVSELQRRLAALPSVVAVTSAKAPDDNSFRTAALAEGQGTSATPHRQSILHYKYIQANYFQTLGIPLFVGRSFPEHGSSPERSVILSESAAKQLWPGANPIGLSLRLGPVDEKPHSERDLSVDGPKYLVIGIARDTRGVEFDGSDARQVYSQLADQNSPGQPMLVRSRSDPSGIVREAGPIVSSIDPEVTVTVSTLDELLRSSAPFIGSRLAGASASAVGFFGLVLALMGIYGTVSYIVVLRTREVGIRMAIGAQARDVLGLILRESLRPVLGGLGVGWVLAIGASYALRVLLFGLGMIDTVSFLGVSLLFLAVGLLAAYPPSRRATRIDPQVALRYE
jgi:putative ABC transport system permease protein